MIYDCFTFYNELDLLEFRLAFVGPHVDRFVIVEANQTFTGKPRDYCFAANHARFARWDDKILYVQVDDMPAGGSDWSREYFQRNAIMRGLTEAAPDDIVLVSDVDEIPDISAVLAGLGDDQPYALEQIQCHFYLNYRLRDWKKAVATRRRNMAVSPNELRMLPEKPRIKGAGWHFSYLMDAGMISEKLSVFSHQEVNTSQINNPDHIARALRGAAPLVASRKKKNDRYHWSPLDPRIDVFLKAHPMAVSQFVMPKPTGMNAVWDTMKRKGWT